MTLIAFVALFSAQAQAQTIPGDTDIRGHIAALEQIHNLPQITPPPQMELNEGMVGIANGGNDMGRIVTFDFAMHKEENWFFNSFYDFDPSIGWTFRWLATTPPTANELPMHTIPAYSQFFGPNDTMLRMDCEYVDFVPPAQSEGLNYVGPDITVYSFEVKAKVNDILEVTAHMHREHHHSPMAADEIVEYWVFHDNYAYPSQDTQVVTVKKLGQPYAHAAAFLQTMDAYGDVDATSLVIGYTPDIASNYVP